MLCCSPEANGGHGEQVNQGSSMVKPSREVEAAGCQADLLTADDAVRTALLHKPHFQQQIDLQPA